MAAVVSKAVDLASVLFSLTTAVAVLLVDSQIVLPQGLYPAPLVRVRRWFAAEFDHYLVADPPPFFQGLIWLALSFLWPVCIANPYAIVTTSLMLSYLSALFGEMLGSGRATPKLVRFYAPFALVAVTLVLRGVCSYSEQPRSDTTGLIVASSAQKKRV